MPYGPNRQPEKKRRPVRIGADEFSWSVRCSLSRQKRNDLVGVDKKSDIVEGRQSRHDGGEIVVVVIDPVALRNGDTFLNVLIQCLEVWTLSQRNDVSRSNHDPRFVHRDPVQLKVSMNDTLSCLRARRRVSGTSNDVVQSAFAENQQILPGVTLYSAGLVEVPVELSVSQPVVEFDLLLLRQPETVVGGLLTTFVHTRRKFLPLQSLDSSVGFINVDTQSAIDSSFRTCVTTHFF